MWLALLSLCTADVSGVSNNDAQAIWQIEIRREAPALLEPYLRDPSPALRSYAAAALGRMRSETDGLRLLAPLAADPDPTVRLAVAEALGLTAGSENVLAQRWAQETDPAVKRALAQSLGRQGGKDAVDLLVAGLSGEVAPAAAEGIGRLAMRKVAGVNTDVVVERLLDTLRWPIGDTRLMAAWALSRFAPTTLPPATVERLFTAADRDPDPVVRAWLARAWGTMAPADQRAKVATLAADADPEVRIAVARLITRGGWSGMQPVIEALLKDKDSRVRAEAAVAVGEIKELPTALLLPLLSATVPAERAAAVRALGVRGALPDGAEAWMGSAQPMPVRVAAVESISARNKLLELALTSTEAGIRSAAVGALIGNDAHPPSSAELRALLRAEDTVLVEAAADYLREHPDATAEAALLGALQRTDLDATSGQMLMRAMVALYLTGKVAKPAPAAAASVRPWLSRVDLGEDGKRLAKMLNLNPGSMPPRDVPSLTEVRTIRSARVLTEEGEIRLSLLPEEAPYTVWNFAKLAEQGYFDGLVFHRVVSDFVIQGGDPRGDGWGGPGYAIPDEINDVPYDTGTVGMALSGPDTGGSQWFITLSPQPHLDGGYTVFAEVTSGMQYARAIDPGERILRVIIERVPATN